MFSLLVAKIQPVEFRQASHLKGLNNMHRNILGVALASAIAPLLPNAASAEQQSLTNQQMAMYSKPSVARIISGCNGTYSLAGQSWKESTGGSGSGFFISSDGYISTNAHVVENVHHLSECDRQLRTEIAKKLAESHYGKQLTQFSTEQLQELITKLAQQLKRNDFEPINFVLTSDGSKFRFEIKSYGAPVGEGKDVAIIKIEIENAPVLKIVDSREVQLQDRVTVAGYPAAADTFQSELLNEKSIVESSFTDGRVSARKLMKDSAPVLQVSAPATHGNSGGPVLNDRGEVIGMLTFRGDTVNDQEVVGFSFVVPANTIMEFVRQAGATNQEGLVEEQYRQGLNLYWQGEYQAAIAKFEEIKRLFPQHSEVDRLMQESQQAIAQGREKPNSTTNSSSSTPSPTSSPPPNSPTFEQPRATNWFPGGEISSWLSSILFAGSVGVAVGGACLMGLNKKLQPAVRQKPRTQLPITAENSDLTKVIATTNLGTITCTTGVLAGQRWEIPAEGLYIGRDRSLCQVVIDDPRISKRQAWIGQRSSRMTAIDLGSSNGTFLNRTDSQRIAEVFLNRGDTLILGDANVAQFLYSPPPLAKSDRTVVDRSAVAEEDRTIMGAPTRCGTMTCISGTLAGQQFDIPPQGLYIGRDSKLAQIVITDRRVSKQHVWIGVRGDRVVAIDQGSSNGTFLNVPGSERIGEIALNSGDTVILCETDVARFQYNQ